ncbi:MAG: restriction endonuclease subunit S [Formosimonas sp.]
MSEWKKVPISSFLTCREGKYKPDSAEVCDLPRLSKIDFSGNIHTSDKPSKTDMIIVQPHDLVISGINVAKGAIAIYQGDTPIAATIHYSSYTFDEAKIDIEYFKRFLQSPVFIETLKTQVKGGIKTEIKPKQFLPLEIQLPSISEQQNIVKYFKSFEQELLELNSELSSQKNHLKQLRQAILQEAIEGKLTKEWRIDNPVVKGDPNTDATALLAQIQAEKQRLIADGKLKKEKPLAPITDAEKSFELPDEWVWVRLGELCTKVTDGFHHTPKKLRTGVVYISATHIRETGIDWHDCQFISEAEHIPLYRKASPLKGDILITNRGAGCGTPAIIDRDIPFSFQNAALIGFNQSFMLNEYLCYFIIAVRDKIIKDFVSGGLQPMLSNVVLKTIDIAVPSIFEQTDIVQKIKHLIAQVDALESELKTRQTQAKQLMQAVLKEAFSPSLSDKTNKELS